MAHNNCSTRGLCEGLTSFSVGSGGRCTAPGPPKLVRRRGSTTLEQLVVQRLDTTNWCGYCVRAKALLESKGIPYEEINLDEEPNFRHKLLELTGGWTVPQILLDGEPIGGYTELWRLDKTGELAERLAA